ISELLQKPKRSNDRRVGGDLEGIMFKGIVACSMDRPPNNDLHEHVINIARGDTALTSSSGNHQNNQCKSTELHFEDTPATSTQLPSSQSSSSSSSSSSSPTGSNSRNGSSTRNDSYARRSRSPLNSGLWISIELLVNLGQIVAAIVVLSLSRDEHPQTPLFAWIIGYTIGCTANLPHLYWRYVYRNSQISERESEQENLPDSTYAVVSSSRALEGDDRHCFFAVWFVVGNVWIFGGHSSSSDAPNLYRLCIVFLTFSCIGYAMPFIICAAICCCFPCIFSIFGVREELGHSRGASSETINALPICKFKSKRSRNRGKEISSENLQEGGILAAGTSKERVISAEDAVCCICLSKYLDNDELRELSCGHFFHVECVDKWLKINALCPLCKCEIGDVAASVFGLHFGRRRGDRRAAGRGLDVTRVAV
ncbi:E3 ubiquitin-protein ligase, partial [Ananas comosus]